jgi:hypothetical protein
MSEAGLRSVALRPSEAQQKALRWTKEELDWWRTRPAGYKVTCLLASSRSHEKAAGVVGSDSGSSILRTAGPNN